MLTPELALGGLPDQIASDLWDQFTDYVYKAKKVPKFLYVNQRFWEDEGARLQNTVHLLDVQVRTSKLMPYDGAFLTHDEHNPDDLAKALKNQEKIGLI